jgi:hypothetical protein
MKNKLLRIFYSSFLFLSLSQEGVCSHLIDKDFEYSSKNQFKGGHDINMEEEQDLLEELFLGNFSPNQDNIYFEALEKEPKEYNQSISEASVFLAEKLQEQKNIKGAALAYAYAYYYDPYNESLDFPKKIKEVAVNLEVRKDKKKFIDVLSNKILELYQ